MKKEMLIVFLLIFFSSIVTALSGVSPSSYDVDFVPNYKGEFTFNFVFDEGVKSEIYVAGDLAKYVSIEQEKVMLNKKIVLVSLNLPEKIEKPGLHRIEIRAKQLAEAGDGIAIVSDVGGIIKVRVPYPGKYAEISFSVSNANAGEKVPYSLTINSRGIEDIFVSPVLQISNENSFSKELKLEPAEIKSAESFTYKDEINTDGLLPGDYNISAIVSYGGESPTIENRIFRLGELKLRIVNYTSIFEKNKVNRFTIDVESIWNNEIDNIYGNVSIIGYREKFLTPTTSIEPWTETQLTGFFDTSQITSEEFQAKINIHYADKIESQIVNLRLKSEFNYMMIVFIGGGILIIGLIISVIVLLMKKNKDEEK